MTIQEVKEILEQYPDAKINEKDGVYFWAHLAPFDSNPIDNKSIKKVKNDATK